MNRLRVSGRQVIRALQKAGFFVIRVKGSHHFMRHPDGRTTVVPVHARSGLAQPDSQGHRTRQTTDAKPLMNQIVVEGRNLIVDAR